jgi:hypothetical protein
MSRQKQVEPLRPSVTHHDNVESVGTGTADPKDDDNPEPNWDWSDEDWEKYNDRN